MGTIDDIRIWDIALTDSEIQATMSQSLTGNEPGLVGCWDFDEGEGTTTADIRHPMTITEQSAEQSG